MAQARALGPVYVGQRDGYTLEPLSPPEPSPTRMRFALSHGERIVYSVGEVLLTDLALYAIHKTAKSGLFSGGSSGSPPKQFSGFEQWKTPDGASVSRLDLELIEFTETEEATEAGSNPSAQLLVSVPRSAVPKRAAMSRSSSSKDDAERAVLVYALPAASPPSEVASSPSRLLQLAVQHAARSKWQRKLEASAISAPEIYSGVHARAYEVPRKGGGAPIPRLLALSNASIYAIRRDGMALTAATGSTACDYWAAGLEGVHTAEQQRIKDKRLPKYPYALVLRWRANSVGWQHATSGDEAGAKLTCLALKSWRELENLCTCLKAISEELKRGGPLQVVPLAA